MNFRTAYSPSLGKEYGLKCPKDESMTKQADLPSTDINLIMARYVKTGLLPELIQREPRYGDFSEVPDYLEAVGIVQLAEEQFMALDAAVRKRFDNDPAQFLEFATDPANGEELVKMGLAEARTSDVDPTPSPASPVPPKGKQGGKKEVKGAPELDPEDG